MCVAEHELDPLYTVKLSKRLVIMRVRDHKEKEDDVLFPDMRGRLWRTRLSPKWLLLVSSSPCSWD